MWLIDGDFPEVEEVFIIVLMAGIGFAVFILALSCFTWYLDRNLRIKALKKSPFNQLYEIGFRAAYIHADTKWLFTEETLEATILGYNIQFNVNRDTPKKVEFTVFVQDAELDKKKYDRLESTFKKENVFFDFDGLVKKYDLRKGSDLTIAQLEKELIFLVEKLKLEGFNPRK